MDPGCVRELPKLLLPCPCVVEVADGRRDIQLLLQVDGMTGD